MCATFVQQNKKYTSMAKISIILDTRKPNKVGLFPIKIKLTNNRTSTTISTGCFAKPTTFTNKPEQAIAKSVPFADEQNAKIKQLYLDYMNAINELTRNGKALLASAATIKDQIERMRDKEIREEVTFSSEIENYIALCNAKKTADGYIYAKEQIHSFMKKKTICFDEITFSCLDAFDRWMQKKGLSVNTRGIVFRNIRTIFNYAIKSDKISYALYPFRNFEIKKAKKEKEYLTIDELKKIINLPLEGAMLNQARDFFLLSFYLCGANPTDLFYMNKPTKGKVHFVRQKIAHTEPETIHITIPAPAQAIIDKYKGKTHMLYFAEKHEYLTFKSRVGKNLKRIGEMVGKHLYMYMARYTWATIADHVGVSHDIISKALGHSDKSTAEKFYISFDWAKVDNANQRVIDSI